MKRFFLSANPLAVGYGVVLSLVGIKYHWSWWVAGTICVGVTVFDSAWRLAVGMWKLQGE